MRNLACALLCFTLLGFGQLPPAGEQEGARRPNREELAGMLEAYIISKLQEALQLNDEQYAKVIVAQKRLNEHRREHQRQRREALQQLQRAVGAVEASDEEIARLLERLDQLRADF